LAFEGLVSESHRFHDFEAGLVEGTNGPGIHRGDLNMSGAAADRLSASHLDDYVVACELYSDVLGRRESAYCSWIELFVQS